MRVLVLGSGAREHAICWKLAASRHVTQVFAGPGNAGTSSVATNLPQVSPERFETVASACRERHVDCVFVGPEAPLAAGIVDFLSAEGIRAIGPNRSSARLESSKAFSKAFLIRNGLPTAAAREFERPDELEGYLRQQAGRRLVVKKSGLASGKGVLESDDTARLFSFGRSVLQEDTLLVEEFLEGWEVSIFGASDGHDFLLLPPCTDFKKARDGDAGPNTGGMGAVCPVPWVHDALLGDIRRLVVEPTYAALRREGLGYAGILYFGLMITAGGPRVLEFNVRLGDPETQVLLPMLGCDLGELCLAMAGGTIGSLPEAVTPRGAAVGVVVASRGYPDAPQKGAVVTCVPPGPGADSVIFHASTVLDEAGRILTGGGRCFTAVGTGDTLAGASERAYEAARRVSFDGAWYRSDIGRKFVKGPA